MTTTGRSFTFDIGGLVEEAIGFARQFYEDNSGGLDSGSQAYREINQNLEVGPGGLWGKKPVEQAYNVASLLYGASNQYLRTLSNILSDEVPLFGFQAVTRALLEAAARSWWILDPSCSTRQRVERAYDELHYSFTEMQNAAKAKGGELESQLTKDHGLRTNAALLGLAEKNKKNSPLQPAVGFGERRDKPTNLVASFLSDLGLEDGEFWYRVFSGVIHSALYAQVGYWEIVPASDTGLPHLQAQRPDAAIRQATILSVSAYFGAIERHALLCGNDWEQLRGERFSVVARIKALRGA